MRLRTFSFSSFPLLFVQSVSAFMCTEGPDSDLNICGELFFPVLSIGVISFLVGLVFLGMTLFDTIKKKKLEAKRELFIGVFLLVLGILLLWLINRAN